MKGEQDISGPPTPVKLNSSTKEQNELSVSAFSDVQETTGQPHDVSSSSGEEHHVNEDEENQSSENAQNQLVLYDPTAKGLDAIVPVSDPVGVSIARNSFRNHTPRVLPSVGAFAVQCNNCLKWRLIPTKEKYEEIREHILEQPFLCETAREWRPEISCDDPGDISQDGSRLWAIDKPNIAQPPPGWQRLLRIRGEGGTRFADVYYVTPSGKRLRSMVEIQRFLEENTQYVEKGVSLSQFSFQIPRPLQQDYVRKRCSRSTPHDTTGSEPSEATPIAWAGPDEDLNLQPGVQGSFAPDNISSFLMPEYQSPKKRKTASKPGGDSACA